MSNGLDSDTANYNFIDVNNYLGCSNQEYKSALYKLALSSPSEYYDLRVKVLKSVKSETIKGLYKSFYNLMLTGTSADGTPVIAVKAGGQSLEPQLPLQQINAFSLGAVQHMSEIVDELVEILMPMDFNKIINAKFAREGLAENPQA